MAKAFLTGSPPCCIPDCVRTANHRVNDAPVCDAHYQRYRNRGTFEPFVSTGISRLPEYRHWINMRSRCNNKAATGYARYGGRGIKVCPAWDASFDAFLRDMGPRPGAGYTVDRMDGNGNYEPGNCRWATRLVQSRNIQTNHIIQAFGRKMTVAEAAERAGIKANTIIYRLQRGWSETDAVTLAPQQGVRPHGA